LGFRTEGNLAGFAVQTALPHGILIHWGGFTEVSELGPVNYGPPPGGDEREQRLTMDNEQSGSQTLPSPDQGAAPVIAGALQAAGVGAVVGGTIGAVTGVAIGIAFAVVRGPITDWLVIAGFGIVVTALVGAIYGAMAGSLAGGLVGTIVKTVRTLRR
jgi:hypothetical protein